MKKLSGLFIFLLFTVIAQGQLPAKIKTKELYTTPSGLKIMFEKINPKNKMALTGDKVKINVIGKLTNDSVWVNTYTHGAPLTFKAGNTQIKGLDEGLSYMHVGDSAVMTIPPALGLGKKMMVKVPADSIIIMTISLVEVMDQPKPFDTKGKDTVSVKDGLKYIVVSKGKGIKVDSGMVATVHYTGYFMDGKMFDSSVDRGEPISIPLGKGKTIKGMEEGIMKLNVGDKARLLIPYYLAFGDTAVGPFPAKSNIIIDIEVISSEKPMTVKPFDVKGKDTITSRSGLKYIMVKEGTGVQAQSGKTVKVHYTGYFLNGKIFDSSVERGQPFSFTLGQRQVIAGWDEGIGLLKVGGKARLIVPYQLGYGEKDYQSIPAKSTLIFDVELLDVK